MNRCWNNSAYVGLERPKTQGVEMASAAMQYLLGCALVGNAMTSRRQNRFNGAVAKLETPIIT